MTNKAKRAVGIKYSESEGDKPHPLLLKAMVI